MLYALGGDPITKTLPADVPKDIGEFCNALIRYDPIERPNWEKENLVQKLLEVRQATFGRKHTDAYSKTKLD